MKPLCLIKVLKDVRFFPTNAAKSSLHCRSWGLELLGTPQGFQRSFRHGDSCEIWEFPMAFAGTNGRMQLLGWWKNHVKVEVFSIWIPPSFFRTPIWWNMKTNWKPVNCCGFQKTVSTRLCLDQTHILQWLVEVMRISCFASNHTHKHSVFPQIIQS